MPPTTRGRYLRSGGRPAFLLGINYWSRAAGPRMWDRWDERRVRAEVRQMRRLGLAACRSFLFAPSFMPRPPAVSEPALARFGRFLGICADAGLATMPSLVVGHMSGENYEFPGQLGRSPYHDPEVRSWQRALCREAALAARGSRALLAWVLSNEMPYFGGSADPDAVLVWARELCGALRAAGPRVPVGSGDGFLDQAGGSNGFDPARLASLLDYLGPHTYYSDTDPMRQVLNAEVIVRWHQPFGLPVLLEEFGGSSCQVSEEHQAAFYRETIHGVLSLGGAGALGWCFSDFDLAEEPPYRHHAFELGFGVTRADGSEKPVCAELRAVSRLCASLDFERLRFPVPRAAILVPSTFHADVPFSQDDRARMRRTLLQAYVLAQKAGLEVAVVPEEQDLGGFQLVLVPATQKLLAPTWERLAAHARSGGTVYVSFFYGDFDHHQGMWIHNFEELAGARHGLRYGVPELPPEVVTLVGDGLTLAAATGASGAFPRAFLPIEPAGAEVVLRDLAGRPALVRNRLGRGQVFFLAYPWEHYLAEQPDINECDASHALYAYLAAAARLAPRYPSPDPRVQLRVVEDGRDDLVWVFNRSWNPVAVDLGLPGCRDATLTPKEVRVVRVRARPARSSRARRGRG
ncbi:MAG: beta-galactosidase trimerization domain-containing protein [Deltaproteobacteria bacterium]|nr:beta-galactosidase trimerization domain-containing protein [Deltaproteobacteria bacterium]